MMKKYRVTWPTITDGEPKDVVAEVRAEYVAGEAISLGRMQHRIELNQATWVGEPIVEEMEEK